MSKQVPWDAIPDSVGNVLPTGMYKLEVEEMLESESKKGKYMLKATFRVLEPVEQAGMVVFDNYTIGSDNDPGGDDPKSWEGIAAARWKDVIKKSATAQRPTVEETCHAAKGMQFLADVTVEVEKEGEYKGRERNRIKKTYRVGEATIPVAGANHNAGGGTVRPFRPGAR